MMATHSTAMMTVQRFRFFSATTGRTRILGETAAEHIGQTAALTLVHQDEQGEHEAEQHDDDLQRDLKSGHRVPPD